MKMRDVLRFKILIQEVVMPEQDTIPLWAERVRRYVTSRCYEL